MLNFVIPVNYFKVVVSLYVETGSSSKRNIVFYNERYCQCCPSDCVTKYLSIFRLGPNAYKNLVSF